MAKTFRSDSKTIAAAETISYSIPAYENNARNLLVIIKNTGAEALTAATVKKTIKDLSLDDSTFATALGSLASGAQASAEYAANSFVSLDLTLTSTVGTTVLIEWALR